LSTTLLLHKVALTPEHDDEVSGQLTVPSEYPAASCWPPGASAICVTSAAAFVLLLVLANSGLRVATCAAQRQQQQQQQQQ
jgi:hypothetical protein